MDKDDEFQSKEKRKKKKIGESIIIYKIYYLLFILNKCLDNYRKEVVSSLTGAR